MSQIHLIRGKTLTCSGSWQDAPYWRTLLLLLLFGASSVGFVNSTQAQLMVSHTGDSGSGSLRQAILDANDREGPDDIEFNIPQTDAGFNQVWWTIRLESALPPLSDSGTRLLGFSQTQNQRDSNPGFVGSGGTVGVVRRDLPRYRKPELAIDAGGFDGLTIEGYASDILIEGIAVYGADNGIVGLGLRAGPGLGTPATSPGTNRLIREVLVGVQPTGLDPESNVNKGHGIVLRASDAGLEAVELDVERCFVGHNGQVGIVGERPSTILRISLSEVFANGWATDAHDGIDVNGVNGVVQFNLSRDNRNARGIPIAGSGAGIEAGSTEPSIGDNLIENNTVRNNLGAGIAIRGGSSGNLVRSNVILGNAVGISVDQAGSAFTDRNIISENSTARNRGQGIDLQAQDSADPSVSLSPFDGITLNSPTSGTMGPNLLQPYPVLTSATLLDDTLHIAGFSSEGATIEVFVSERDVTGFGEGVRHLLTIHESSATDVDSTTGEYGPTLEPSTVGGTRVTVSTEPLLANRFSFVIPFRPLWGDQGRATDVALLLTATERVSANTSEFGPTVVVTRLPGRVRLIEPMANAIAVAIPTVFTWSRAAAADNYELQVSTRRDLTRLIVDERGLPRPGFRTDLLDEDTRYVWRARARNRSGTGRWSDWSLFKTVRRDTTSSPPPPQLIYPRPEQTNVELAVTFIWSHVDDADHYRFKLSKLPPGSDNRFKDSSFVSVQDTTLDWLLTPDQEYYWYVASENDVGVAWSPEIWTFDTDTTALPPVETVGQVSGMIPAHDSTRVSTVTEFEWKRARNAETYRIEISSDSAFASILDGARDLVPTRFIRDVPLENGETYYWRVRGENADTVGVWVSATFTTIRYHVEFLEPTGKTRLTQNRPNPFNPTTTIDFELKEASEVDLSVYDIQGRLVRTLERGFLQAGVHRTVWDGRNASGRPAPSGVYLYRILSKDHAETKRMLLLK